MKHYREIFTVEILWPGEVDDSVTDLSILAQFAQVMAEAVIMRPFLQKMKENFGSDFTLSFQHDWFLFMFDIENGIYSELSDSFKIETFA